MINFDKKKNECLKKNRGVSFDDFKGIIESESYIAIVDNPARARQFICLLRYNGYVFAVPFVVDMERNMVLKTMYPTRKYNKLYS